MKKEPGLKNHVQQMALTHKKRCLALFIAREMQIKSITTDHLSPIRAAKIQKLTVHCTGTAVGRQTSFSITGGMTEWYKHYRGKCRDR